MLSRLSMSLDKTDFSISTSKNLFVIINNHEHVLSHKVPKVAVVPKGPLQDLAKLVQVVLSS